MKRTIRRISGSLYVAISAAAGELGIKKGDEVEILRKGKNIIIKKTDKGDKNND